MAGSQPSRRSCPAAPLAAAETPARAGSSNSWAEILPGMPRRPTSRRATAPSRASRFRSPRRCPEVIEAKRHHRPADPAGDAAEEGRRSSRPTKSASRSIRALRAGIAAARRLRSRAPARARSCAGFLTANTRTPSPPLFGRRVDTLGLTADFPKEKTARHLDTIGQSLVTSGFLLDQYFQSANRLVETRLGKPATAAADLALQQATSSNTRS